MAKLTPEMRKKLGGTKGSGSGANIRHGRYALMITKMFMKTDGHKGTSEIREFVVVEAEKVVVMEGDKKREDEPNAVGSTCSAVAAYFGTSKDMGPVNTVRFVQGLFDYKDGDISEDDQAQTIAECLNDDPAEGPVNPLRGMIIGLETLPICTSTNKKWIVGYRWFCIDKPQQGINTQAEADKRWKEYEEKVRGAAAAAAAK